MGIAAIILGILSFIGMIVAFFPCLGSLNWLNIPFAVIGLVISIIATVTEKEKAKGTIGIVLCGIAILLGTIRLILGWGIV
jgi:hypothetical protein